MAETFVLAETAMREKGAADAAALAERTVAGEAADRELLEKKFMIPTWRERDYTDVPIGTPYKWNDVVYKLLQPHDATGNPGWTPDTVPALWAAVSVGAAGTLEDPITAVRGMEYTYGLYYLDGEDGKTYVCVRSGEEIGGKVILQYLPHELVGQYFEEAAR